MRKLNYLYLLAVLALLGLVIGSAWMGDAEAQAPQLEVVRVTPKADDDTTMVLRYGTDFQYAITCYVTNPRRFGKGHPSLSCVALFLGRNDAPR